jgi:hypothetical protein
MTTGHRSTLLLALALAACGDPTVAGAPTGVDRIPATRAAPLYAEPPNPQVTVSPDYTIPVMPTVQGNVAVMNACIYNLRANHWQGTGERGQTLKWDSTDMQGRPRREIFHGGAKIFYTYWAGTYQGQPNRCIQLDSVKFRRVSYEYIIPISQPTLRYDTKFSWCWGYALNAVNASPWCVGANGRITLTVRLDYGRNCFVDDPNRAAGELYVLGGHNEPSPWYPMEWIWRVWAVDPQGRYGFWTVDDYGGQQSPHWNGWWNSGPGTQHICSHFGNIQNAAYVTYRGGNGIWGYPEGAY